MIRMLMRDRGERPDGRHYVAMILANADAENGSASEVEVLLKEMAAEGIALSSGAYHAILKVCTETGAPLDGAKELGITRSRLSPSTRTTCYAPPSSRR